MMGKLFALALVALTFTAISSEGAIGLHSSADSYFGNSVPVFHDSTKKTGSMTCDLSHASDMSDKTASANQTLIADDLSVLNHDKKDLPCHHGTGMKKCHHKGAFSLLALSMPCHERCRMQAENRNDTLSKSYNEGKLQKPQQISIDVDLVEFKLSYIRPAIFISLSEEVDSPPPRNIS